MTAASKLLIKHGAQRALATGMTAEISECRMTFTQTTCVDDEEPARIHANVDAISPNTTSNDGSIIFITVSAQKSSNSVHLSSQAKIPLSNTSSADNDRPYNTASGARPRHEIRSRRDPAASDPAIPCSEEKDIAQAQLARNRHQAVLSKGSETLQSQALAHTTGCLK